MSMDLENEPADEFNRNYSLGKYKDALDSAREIHDEHERVKSLIAIVPYLSESKRGSD